jgi:RNA polymerase subunit RPABC4/transcription elongation factor Spt4
VKPCRECRHQVSEQAFACPQCGAPFPAREKWNGFGFEYKSEASIAGWPLLHISFKYRADRRPVVARGIIAIGQFGYGVVCIAQFGVGLVSIAQFTVAGFALAQFAVAWSLIAQFGLYVSEGHGPIVVSLAKLLGLG